MCYEDSGFSSIENFSVPQTQTRVHNLSLFCFSPTYRLRSTSLLSFGIIVDCWSLHGWRVWLTTYVPCCCEADASKESVATYRCWNILFVVGVGHS